MSDACRFCTPEEQRVLDVVEGATEPARGLLLACWHAASWANAAAGNWGYQHEVRMVAVGIRDWVTAVKEHRAANRKDDPPTYDELAQALHDYCNNPQSELAREHAQRTLGRIPDAV